MFFNIYFVSDKNEEARERDMLRRERHNERARERNLARAAPDKRCGLNTIIEIFRTCSRINTVIIKKKNGTKNVEYFKRNFTEKDYLGDILEKFV